MNFYFIREPKLKRCLSASMISQNKQLIELFEPQKFIKLVYLFGSVSRGKEGKLSDIDLGILLDNSLNKRRVFDLQLELIGKITTILKTHHLDLIIMNDAPLSLNFEIIKANYPIYVRNETERIDFEHYILSRYLDRRYYEVRSMNEFFKNVIDQGI